MLVDSQSAVYTVNEDLSCVIPVDDTPPMKTEGTKVCEVTIAASSPTDKIRIQTNGWGVSSQTFPLTAALFVDEEQFARRAVPANPPASGFTASNNLFYEHCPGDTEPHTYKLHLGSSSGIARMNGTASSRLYGATSATTMSVDVISTGQEWSTLGQWRLASASNPFSPRDGAGLLELNGIFYLLGGWNDYPTAFGPLKTTNQVLMSKDRCQTWQPLPNAPWQPRHMSGWLVHDGKIWVIGGDTNQGNYQTDVWYAIQLPDGSLEWHCATMAAPWAMAGRTLHQVFSFAGKMWVMGGQTLDGPAAPFAPSPVGPRAPVFYSDVWNSEDGGNWDMISDGNAWAPRSMIIGGAVKDGYMWLIGGGAYDTGGLPRVYKNDVIRTQDGINFETVLANAPFCPRQFHNVLVNGEDLVVIAGWNGDNIADAWASKDGVKWRELRGVPFWKRHAASACSFKNEIYFGLAPLTQDGPFHPTAFFAMS